MSTWTNTAKNTSSFTNQTKSDILAHITTDAPDYVLLGSSEDEVLIWNQPSVWSNATKN